LKRFRNFMPTALQDRTNGLGRASLSADYLSTVTRVDEQLEHRKLLAFDRANLNLIGGYPRAFGIASTSSFT
jgi:hypothetical protein